jgi:hypothetical protein
MWWSSSNSSRFISDGFSCDFMLNSFWVKKILVPECRRPPCCSISILVYSKWSNCLACIQKSARGSQKLRLPGSAAGPRSQCQCRCFLEAFQTPFVPLGPIFLSAAPKIPKKYLILMANIARPRNHNIFATVVSPVEF